MISGTLYKNQEQLQVSLSSYIGLSNKSRSDRAQRDQVQNNQVQREKGKTLSYKNQVSLDHSHIIFAQ